VKHLTPVVALTLGLGVSAQPQRGPAASSGEIVLTAASANVSQSGMPVKIRLLRWSSDQERAPLIAALTPAPDPASPAGRASTAARAGAPPAGANSGAAGGTSGAATPAGETPSAAARGGRAAAAGRGARGRGARGRGDAASLTPMAALALAIARAPTIGYLWTSDITGYAIKYAFHRTLPEGGERIVVATNRRLGAYTGAWTAASSPTGTDEEFTVIEIRLDGKGVGEGKSSLTSKVIVDNDSNTFGLENYGAAPAMLRDVRLAMKD